MNVRRSTVVRGLVGTMAALLVVLVSASAAGAVTGHRPSRSFGTVDPGKLTGIGGLVTRAASSDVFVLDPFASPGPLVRRYTQAGDYDELGSFDVSPNVTGPTAIARDPVSGDLYVAGTSTVPDADGNLNGTVARFTSAGVFKSYVDLRPTALGSSPVYVVSSLAVDSTGRLYVGDAYSPRAVLFSDAGAYLRVLDGTTSGTPITTIGPIVATDSAGNVYVADLGVNVQKFNSAGTYVSTLASSQPRAIAVDLGNNDVYSVDSPDGVRYGVTRFLSTGVRQERFGETSDFNVFGALSADATTHNLFAGNRNTNAVDVFTTFTAPDAVTNAPPVNPGTTTVNVSGTVNPRGQGNTNYSFEYGPDSSYGSSTTPTPVTGSATVTRTAQLTDLNPNATYHYRLKVTNGQGTNYGQDRTVTTAAAPPTVSSESATTTAFTATLNASVNPNNNETRAHFEYGTSAGNYTESTDPVTLFAGSTPQALPATTIQGLAPETTYHYRVVAENGVGNGTNGADQTFVTKPAPPLAAPGVVSGVSGGSAQFSGTADTQGLEGYVSFVVTAKNSPYQAVTAQQYLPAGSSAARTVTGSISGLPAGGVFEVRTRVQTSTRTVLSEPMVFSTASLATMVVPTPVAGSPLPTGCLIPRLAAPTRTLRAGKAVTLTGTDFGTSGSVAFGSRVGRVEQYSPTRISVVVPSTAKGKTPITVTCGNVSNTVTASVDGASKPSNSYRLSTSTKGSKATVKLKVPGRGKVLVKGKGIATKRANPKKAGTVSVKVGLSKSARKSLARAKSKRLSVKIEVRYHPTGGSTRKAKRTLVFRR